MADPSFWDSQEEAQKVIAEANGLKELVHTFDKNEEKLENVEVSYELVKEEDDADLRAELEADVSSLTEALNRYELFILLSEPYDKNNAILELHPGAGGTESQDWASMLLRMYTRWAESKGYKVETLDYLPGDEAGVKSVTLLIKGHNAYGYLKAEKGVHRLVRISPFDASGRRHTSFASCDIMPELDDDIDLDIKTEDLKIDTYRSSGAGGQHVNTTDSAVRITHLPTNTVVTCQSERSQIKNREQAMKMLKAKLYQLEIEKQQEALNDIRGEQKEIGWGSQIRSYVFHPYSMVKDHRTDKETGNTQAVMDGELDPFIDAYLRFSMN
ncbi:peptide chain release factor 2 (bRF-2) [Saliterribacillus persicus]|uniref:Peptide chain release factor 2 n=2 Tax=Saliterribacillus persicus TaxID=930114 RepID=A0A368XGJ0_9BACI|nr:peptide chain release factor 2 (bRF-2) [Saliterribacillus persicus]